MGGYNLVMTNKKSKITCIEGEDEANLHDYGTTTQRGSRSSEEE